MPTFLYISPICAVLSIHPLCLIFPISFSFLILLFAQTYCNLICRKLALFCRLLSVPFPHLLISAIMMFSSVNLLPSLTSLTASSFFSPFHFTHFRFYHIPSYSFSPFPFIISPSSFPLLSHSSPTFSLSHHHLLSSSLSHHHLFPLSTPFVSSPPPSPIITSSLSHHHLSPPPSPSPYHLTAGQ